MTKRNDILNQLKQYKALSTLELQLLNDMPAGSLRKRISELRKEGYIINRKEIPTYKYILSEKNLIEDYIQKNNLFGIQLSITNLSKRLKTSENNITTLISQLFNKYNILQLSSDKVIINKKEGKNERTNRI